MVVESTLPEYGKIDYLGYFDPAMKGLANRKRIEEQTKTWDKTVIGRQNDLRSWGAAASCGGYKSANIAQRHIMEDRFYWLTMELLSKIIGPFEGLDPGED